MTKKLFLEDAYCHEFRCNIINIIEEDAYFLLELDETCFYPEGGGQPSDFGLIEYVQILDVFYKDGTIYHKVDQLPNKTNNLLCEVNWPRRFDFMQQHTGQHILSASFEKLFDGNTIGFHLSETYASIDIDKKLQLKDVILVENLSNSVIYKNLEIKTHYPTIDELYMYNLRKSPTVVENIRIIEIDNFDFSPCGGTHTKNTGEIGIIKIKKIENYKSGIRIEFLCGKRALEDYQMKNDTVNEIAINLSVRSEEVLINYNKLIEEFNLLKTKNKNLEESLIEYQIEELKKSSVQINNIKLIVKEFKDYDMKSVKKIASTIVSDNSFVTLFSILDNDVKLIFSCSKNVDINMKDLIKTPLELIDGNGGGNIYSAQGGGSNIKNLDKAMQISVDKIKQITT